MSDENLKRDAVRATFLQVAYVVLLGIAAILYPDLEGVFVGYLFLVLYGMALGAVYMLQYLYPGSRVVRAVFCRGRLGEEYLYSRWIAFTRKRFSWVLMSLVVLELIAVLSVHLFLILSLFGLFGGESIALPFFVLGFILGMFSAALYGAMATIFLLRRYVPWDS